MMDTWLTIIISSVAVCEQIDHNIILAIILYFISPVAIKGLPNQSLASETTNKQQV